MKKTITFAIMAFLALTSQAQLKVDSLGAIGVGVNPQSPYKLSVSSSRNAIQGTSTEYRSDSTAAGIVGQAYTIYHGKAFGVRGKVYSRTGIMDGKCFGVYGYAGGSASGESFGVFGQMGSYGNGAGVYGSSYFGEDYGQMLTSRYAGYFNGNVEITNNLTVSGTLLYSYSNLSRRDENNSQAESAEGYTGQLKNLSIQHYDYKPLRSISGKREDGTEKCFEEDSLPEIERQAISKIHYGLEPEQLEKVFPDLVYENEEGTKSINYIEMVPLLVQAINELSAEVTILRQELGVQDPTKPALKAKGKEEDADHVTLTIPDDALRTAIRIYDMSGKLVCSKDVEEKGRVRLSDYTKRLPIGTYTYSLLVDGKVQATRKMMVVE